MNPLRLAALDASPFCEAKGGGMRGTLMVMTTTKVQEGVCNVPNRTIFEGNNLDVMRGMNDGCVDLIYLDPPFNSNRDYAARIRSVAEVLGEGWLSEPRIGRILGMVRILGVGGIWAV